MSFHYLSRGTDAPSDHRRPRSLPKAPATDIDRLLDSVFIKAPEGPMDYEDVAVVALRVTLLLLTSLIGIPGNIVAMCQKARSFKTQGVNSIAYIHLAFVDLLICIVHAPIGTLLELCGYFNLRNNIGYNLRSILFYLNRIVSMRVFAFTSFTSLVTLAVIALFRCWRIFNPFGHPRKRIMVVMLAVPDILTVSFILFIQKTPSMYYVSTLNSSETNSSVSMVESSWSLDGLTQTEVDIAGGQDFNESSSLSVDNATLLSSGKTLVEDHGLLEPLIVYTVLVTLTSLTACYSLICYKIHQGYRKLSEGFTDSSGKNEVQRKFLSRQVSHVKTQFILIMTLFTTAMPTLVIALVGFTPSYAVLRLRTTVVALGSGINPFVYCLLTAESRRAITQFFTRRKEKTSSVSSQATK